MLAVGARIRRLRDAQGVSQSELVRRTGLQASYLSKVEHQVVVPGLGNLERIARALGLDLAQLLAPSRRRRRGPAGSFRT